MKFIISVLIYVLIIIHKDLFSHFPFINVQVTKD